MSIEANTKNVQQLVVNQLGVANGQITEPYDASHRYNIADGQVAPAKLSTGHPNWDTGGNAYVINNLFVNGDTDDGAVEINKQVTGEGNAVIDLHSTSATNPDFDARIASYTNGSMYVVNKRTDQPLLLSTTNSSGTTAAKVRINGDGNVGIATGSPQEKLHVAGNIRVHGGGTVAQDDHKQGLLQLANSKTDSDSTTSLSLDPNELLAKTDMFYRVGTTKNADGTFSSHNNHTFSRVRETPYNFTNSAGEADTSYNENMMVIRSRAGTGNTETNLKNLGEVNIGCDFQAVYGAKLYVQNKVHSSYPNQSVLTLRHFDGGDRNYINFINGTTNIGQIKSVGNVLSLGENSDYRLKEDIIDIDSSVEKVKQLKPRNFNWKSDGVNADGFIAHELAEVCPQAVDGEKDAMRTQEVVISDELLGKNNEVIQEAVIEEQEVADYQTVDQTKLIPILTKALQEALAKIESLEARVDALENA